MLEDIEQLLRHAVQTGISEAIKHKLNQGYSSPYEKLLTQIIEAEIEPVKTLLSGVVKGLVEEPEFRESVRQQLRNKLAGLLVARFGGELERQVNQLKSDPVTRAKITTALAGIVGEQSV